MNELYYIDTHVHLNDDTIYKHLEEVLNDAKLNNVKEFYIPGWDKESSKQAVELSERYDNVYAIIGYHPCNIKGYTEEDYNLLYELAKCKKVVAIGEIGYDFHWDDTTKEEQEYAFKKQLEIARNLNLPVSIHAREADQATFDMIKKYGNGIKGVLHAYSGSVELAKEYIKLGFIFGIGGVVTFKNAKTIKNVVEQIDLKYFITETDSPYLAPTPHRGEENGPKYIPLIVDEIALVKNISKEEVMEQVLNNAHHLFNKDI